MQEKEINERLDMLTRTSMLLGVVTGSISGILGSLKNGSYYDAQENLEKLHTLLLEKIDDIYYKKMNHD